LHGLQAERGTTLINSAPHRSAVRSLVIVAILVIALDSATKTWALHSLSSDPRKIIGSFLEFQLTSNTGAAFSLAQSATIFLSLLSFLAICAIAIFARSITSRAWGIALGFLLGGISGNLYDRTFRPPYLLHGAVVDWLRLPHWPIFNLADTSIVISAITIAILLVNDVKPRSRHDVP
jgi:signal peptidase II